MSLDVLAKLVSKRGNEAVVMDLVLCGLFSFICNEQFHGCSRILQIHVVAQTTRQVHVPLMSGR